MSGSQNKKVSPYLIYISAAIITVILANFVFNFFSNYVRKQKNDPAPITKPVCRKTTIKTPAPKKPLPAQTENTPKPPAAQQTPAPAPIPTPAAAPEPIIPPTFILSGIFIADNDAYAIIDNKVVRKLDKVHEATVQKISLEGVELDYKGVLVKIRKPK
jgi:hypothetical protein